MTFNTICISSGHGLHVRGAAGPEPWGLDEVDEARQVVDQLAEDLRARGVEVDVFHDDVSKSQNENLNRIVDHHNAEFRDIDVSVHFNAFESTSKPMGVEVLYVSQQQLAAQVSAAIATVTGLPNRGAKKRTDLFFLNKTHEPAILIEVCFVDSQADVKAYKAKFTEICRAIADVLGGEADQEELPPEPPEEVLPPEPPELSDVAHGHYDNITATVFGGASDPNNSAYDGHVLNDTDLYVALPFKFKGERPQVQVWHGEAYGIATIEDVGPWLIDDDYWTHRRRPIAEECYHHKKPLPRGPHKGKVPSNGAGIDLSPALARLIGVEGKAQISWRFTGWGEV